MPRAKTLVLLVVVLLAGANLLAQNTRTVITLHKAPPTDGAAMYQAYCASCHGPTGTGNGMYASALHPAPADLTVMQRARGGKSPRRDVFSMLYAGVPYRPTTMPHWRLQLKDVSRHDDMELHMRMVNLAHYIESLQVQ